MTVTPSHGGRRRCDQPGWSVGGKGVRQVQVQSDGHVQLQKAVENVKKNFSQIGYGTAKFCGKSA